MIHEDFFLCKNFKNWFLQFCWKVWSSNFLEFVMDMKNVGAYIDVHIIFNFNNLNLKMYYM